MSEPPADGTDSPADETQPATATAQSADPNAILVDDPDLGPVVDEHGPVSIDPAEDFFERFLTSIVRQQMSMASAAAIRERLFDAVEVTPVGVLAADEETLLDTGLSGPKVRYVRNVATAFEERDWSSERFDGMDDEAVVAELTDVTGVGEWTANMQLMFSLGREDVFPVGDLGIRKGMHAVVDPDLDREEMVAHAERWSPYRSYASLYLWRAVEG